MQRLVWGRFEIDQDGCRLLRDGAEVAIERRALDLLCYLAQRPGQLIRKEELLTEVWNAHALSDGVLSNTIAKLRKLLEQPARAREPIETVHGRGYRFHAVLEVPPPTAASSVALEAVSSAESRSERSDAFIGRHVILNILEQCVTQASQSNGQLVLITGEAGIGKSRTLRELAQRARARGFSVWTGAAHAAGAAPAYWPWVEVVRSALATRTTREQIPDDSWALATLVPEWLGPPQPAVDVQTLRFRLFDELTRWFATSSTETPRLIALEDLHWADQGSIELLGYLARGLEQHRVVLAATWRDHDPDWDSTRAAAVQRLVRMATHVALRGLSRAEVVELVTTLAAAQQPDANTVDVLYARTQGNPFYIQQLLQLLAQRGLPLTGASLAAAELPPAVRDVVRQRLAMLAPETRPLLAAASVIGHAFDAELLAELTDQALAPVLRALDPGLRLEVISQQPLAGHRFEFNHALLRDSLYDALGLVERGGFHARLAGLLGARSVGDDEGRLGEIARHSLLAVPFDLEACVRRCRLAADAARDVLGFEAAAEYVSLALDKLAAAGGKSESCCELLFQLSLDQFCAGDIPASFTALERGVRLAHEIGALHWLAGFASRLASARDIGGNAADLSLIIEDVLLRRDDADGGMRAMLLARRAELGIDLDPQQRHALYSEAQALAERVGTPEVLLEVAHARLGQRDPTRVAESRSAIAQYRVLADRYPQAVFGVMQRLRRFAVEVTDCWSSLVSGDLASADLALARCHTAAEASRVPQMRCTVEMLRAGRALGDARYDDVSACVQRLRSNSDLAAGFEMAWLFFSVLLAEAQGDWQAVLQWGQHIDPASYERMPQRQREAGGIHSALLTAKSGNPTLAREMLSAHVNGPSALPRMPVQHGDLGMLCILAELYCELDDVSRAEQLYTQLAPYAGLNAVNLAFDYRGSVSLYLGMLALLLGRPSHAIEHLQAAVTFNRKLGMPLQVRRSRELLARASSQS